MIFDRPSLKVYIFISRHFAHSQCQTWYKTNIRYLSFFNKHSINLFDGRIGHEKEIVKNYCQVFYNIFTLKL
jgi:hypothetical protein